MLEDEQTTRRFLSGLKFLEEDLRSIEKLNIKTKKVKQLISEIRERIESLLNLSFPFRKKL